MKQCFKRAMAVLLTLMLLSTSIGITAFAEEGTIEVPLKTETTWKGLQAMINAAEGSAKTITLSRDVTAPADGTDLTVPKGTSITLDLNCCTLNLGLTAAQADGNVITVNGSLTVTDSRNAKTGTITGSKSTGTVGGVKVAGTDTFTLDGGAVTGNKADGSDSHSHHGGGVYVNGGTFNLNGGAIRDNSASGGSSYASFIGGVFVNSGACSSSAHQQ
ncbi:MAG: hypothetical protein IIY43_08220 [Oscillospiraceae bacterium]|nr:hypothetical protein [Oscillospiraceae bacterium]